MGAVARRSGGSLLGLVGKRVRDHGRPDDGVNLLDVQILLCDGDREPKTSSAIAASRSPHEGERAKAGT
ncbi:MAG: hypothetical protein ACRDGT_07725 [Candidatus Limnocylindria bacterium]